MGARRNDHRGKGTKHMRTASLFEREAIPQMESLRNFAASLTRDRDRANDLVQDTMLKALRYFDTYTEGTNCRAWLFQICKHSYINEYRRKRYEPVAVDFQDGSLSVKSGRDEDNVWELRPLLRDDSALEAHDATMGDEVSTALHRLPADYQTALMLCDVEGYTYEEIAEFTGTPIGTVRSRIHRGRKMLFHTLASYARNFGYGVETGVPFEGKEAA